MTKKSCSNIFLTRIFCHSGGSTGSRGSGPPPPMGQHPITNVIPFLSLNFIIVNLTTSVHYDMVIPCMIIYWDTMVYSLILRSMHIHPVHKNFIVLAKNQKSVLDCLPKMQIYMGEMIAEKYVGGKPGYWEPPKSHKCTHFSSSSRLVAELF